MNRLICAIAPTPEIRQLRYFEAVCRLRSFSRAAGELHISQQALSQQIQRLETQLDTSLLLRSTRMVEPTPAGETLAEEARRILRMAERAVERTLAAAAQTSEVRLAYTLASANRIIPRLLEATARSTNETRVATREMFASDIPAALLEERIDLAVLPRVDPPPGLSIETLLEDPLVVALGEDHRLSAMEEVALPELADEQIQAWPREMSPGYYDAIDAACRSAGFEPNIDVSAGGNPAWKTIAEGGGIGIIAGSQSDSLQSAIVTVPIADPTPTMCIGLMFRKSEPIRAINDLRKLLVEASAVFD